MDFHTGRPHGSAAGYQLKKPDPINNLKKIFLQIIEYLCLIDLLQLYSDQVQPKYDKFVSCIL